MSKKNYLNRTVLLAMLFIAIAWLPSMGDQGRALAAVHEVQQQGTIRGTVVDEFGEPVIGANVLVEGTTVGTITDIDGNFVLNAQPGAKIKISFIGYTDQVLEARNGMKVVLKEDSQTLQEVEIVAYGVQKKVTVTGAIASVKAEDLNRTPVGTVSNVLGGQMSGLTTVQYSGEPGEDMADIFIRGKATFNDAEPLVQIDGVVRDMADMGRLDPNEIESISVLKDASATAVFGIRGANGVILVTTKRGQNGKAKISATASFSMVNPTKMVKMANSYEYATFYNAMRANDGLDAVFSDEVMQKFKDHSDPIRFPDTNWVDYVMGGSTLQQNHNVSISGGTDKVRYFISTGFYSQGGLFNEYDLPYHVSYQYKRYNYRANIDMDVTKTTALSFNISGNLDNKDQPNNSQGTSGVVKYIYYATPFSSPGIVDHKLIYTTTDVYSDGLSLPFTGGTGFTYYNGKSQHNSTNKLSADISLTQKLDFVTKGLSFKLKGAYNSSFTSYKTAEAGIASYTPVLKADGTLAYKKDGEDSQTVYSMSSTGKARDWYMEASFNYNRSFGDHNVTGLLLYNQSKQYYYGSTYTDVPRGYVGIVGRVTYDWKNRYMADFNFGYNGSENFAPDKRFGSFPAGSVGWAVSEEKFFEKLKPWVSFLKLRFSLGLVGNDKSSYRFLYLADPYSVNLESEANRGDGANFGYYFGDYYGSTSFQDGAIEASKNNADVTWEKARKANYGVDANFFENRLNTTFEYYTEKRWGILIQDGTAPGFLGFSVPYANNGKVNSWGWELSLKWNDKIKENFRYWANFNLSYNQNKVIERKEAPQDNAYQYLKGHRIGSRSQYVFFRYYDSETPELYEKKFHRPYPEQIVTDLQNGDAVYVDLNGDRVVDSNDMSYDYGYTNDPRYMAGLTLGFSWKNWEFSMQWTGAWKVSRAISDVYKRPFVSSSGQTDGGLVKYHLNNTWTADNPSQSAKYPRATWDNASQNYATSTLYEQDSKYLRLKTVQIAYNFNAPFMKKVGLSDMQLALSGYNILTFSPYIWGDPEAVASNAPAYPLTKTYSISLKVGF